MFAPLAKTGEAFASSSSSSSSPPAAGAIHYYLPAAVLVFIGWLWHTFSLGSPVFPVDDAYITLHNAQVLVSGNPDPNFAGTPALAGATSPLHLAVVSALILIGLAPLWALDTAAWLGTLLFALGMMRLCRAFAMPVWPAYFLCLAGLLCARTPHQLMNGLETSWALAGIIWALALSAGEGKKCGIGMAAVCGTLPFLRPELAALSLLLLPLPAWNRWKATKDATETLRLLGLCCGSFVLAALPWLAWQFAVSGSFVPATIAAKRYYFAEAGLPFDIKRSWVQGQFFAFLGACGLLSLAGLFLFKTSQGKMGLLFTAVFLTVYYHQFPGALGHYEGRYLYVLLPLLLFGAASAFRQFAAHAVRLRWLTLFVLVAAVQSMLSAPLIWREHQNGRAFTRVELAGVADWCRKNLPPGSRLLIHDAGYISYATDFPMADIVGLKTPANIPLHRDATYASNGAARPLAIHAAALTSNAQYLVVLNDWDGIFRITDGLRTYGWQVLPRRDKGAYRVYQLTPPRR